MDVIKTLYIDLRDPTIIPEIHVPRNDSRLRVFKFYLYDGETEYEVPTDASVTIQGRKPDRNGFTYECSYAGNLVAVNCREQMTAVIGDTICQIVIVENTTKRVSSFIFHLIVEESATDDTTVYSESDLAYAVQVINELQSIGAYNNRLVALETKPLMSAMYVESTETARFYKA